MSAITLTLLLPGKAVPVQNWTFSTESVIRIGRATDNNVILYSAVVSRHHLELRHGQEGWEAVNIGANGTYVDGQSISSAPVVDGMIIRLASSGPKIQIHLDTHAKPPLPEQIHTPHHHSPDEKPAHQTLISSN
ncbi:FHA domain-containing protein [Synechocystis sp. LKSZ1]|uniref:FHA domain-containing protein n=1 Tax=Synechocystis sp. LKSZ1 TaxID=3144951 RepID=UPI00336BEFA0